MGDQANRAAAQRLAEVVESADMRALADALDELTTDDFVQEWPQSGERIRGRDRAREILSSYADATGTSPTGKMRRLTGSGDTFVIESVLDYGDGVPVSYVGIAEFRDGRVAKITEYFANPFEAPAWRADKVERMDAVPA